MTTTGKILERRLLVDPQQKYYLYVPTKLARPASIFVTVHGISRNALEHATSFAPFAERYGVVLVAPYFPAKEFAGYQRLKERGMRASDAALDHILREVGIATGARTEPFYLFGYSGGGQFAHRYAMAHPLKVARLSIGAAGWYTFPSPKEAYPMGTLVGNKYKGLQFEPSAYLKVPAQVVVGSRDKRLDEELNQSQKITRQQGLTRLKRGQAWVNAMQAASASMGFQTEYTFALMNRCSHSFRDCMERGRMGELVFTFLFGASESLRPPGGNKESTSYRSAMLDDHTDASTCRP